MPITFVRGDLFTHHGLDGLAHGCNCAGAMGKGIAREFRSRFPKMYAEYRRRCEEGRFNLGDVFTWTENGVTLFNLGTQRTWKTKAEMPAIETALVKMVHAAESQRVGQIGLPRIGAGLGGLPWDPIRSLLIRIGEGTHVGLTVFEEYVPARTGAL